MRTTLLSIGLLAWLVSLVSATALTYKLSANEKACFYAAPEKAGLKIAFYFAVQSGGSFDIDYEVTGPNDKVILDGEKERQGDFVFTANELGEYKFCFNNEMSTYSEKFVDFEIAVEDEIRAQLPAKQGTTPEQTTVLEESIYKVSGQLSTITRNQKYFRTRENRNFSTVRSTEGRIVNFSLIQCAMVVCMGALQVFIVRFFFQVWSLSLISVAMQPLMGYLRVHAKVTASAALPKPKYTGEDEDIPAHAQQRGPRIVGAGQIDESQIVLRRTGPPPYGQRAGWRPRGQEDFGDGGAFPEIPVAQYPLDMGKKGSDTSNALAIQVDADGKVKYDAIAKQGHGDGRIVHASFKDLIPLRQRADAGEVDLSRPGQESVEETAERTRNALEKLVGSAVSAQKPKNVNVQSKREATFVRYTPANQMGDNSKKQDRIMKIVERQRDPMEPPKFKHKKIPRGPPSPPPPVLHSPPRKLTAEDQEMWKIPPPVSNWKNPKGFTVPLDKRLAADGRGLQDVAINDKFAQFSEALFMADRHAREEVRQRALMQQRLAEKEKAQKEDNLRMLAQKAREERAGASRRRRDSSGSRDSRDSRSRSRSYSYSDSGSDSEELDVREREKARAEKRREEERKLRQSRMGTERRIQVMAREQNRDISEKIALGLAKPTAQAESMYDSRLFNQSSGFDSGINEDNPYDKPLFAAQDAINSIYRPSQNMEDFDDDAGDREMAKIQKTSRFGEALGRGTFKGTADAEAREGPVQFERDNAGADPFQMDKFMAEVDQSASSKRGYGLQEGESRQPKRAKVDEDDD
ncbi:SKIP/SNW domain-containing protein [Xylariaceae sp. FL0016]|nr:SKIP/SNW domain-containing protein [Xylariaceae sp. FL0016]